MSQRRGFATHSGSTLSLAMLEVLVHVASPRVLRDFRMLDVDVPDDAIIDLDQSDLDLSEGATLATRSAGDRFLTDARAIALRVASIVNPHEFNVVINPKHPDIGRVSLGTMRPLEFDPRLK